MKNRIREMVLLSALVAIAAIPALAQDATATVAVATARCGCRLPRRPGRPPGACPKGGRFSRTTGCAATWTSTSPRRTTSRTSAAARSRRPIIIAAGGANSPCNAYARYLMGGYLEVQPFGKTFARHVFVFFTPTFSFGNNVPQFKYTASMAGIAFERAVGVGIELPKNFEIRVTQHQVDWLGKYKSTIVGMPGRTSAPPDPTACTQRSARAGISAATAARAKDARIHLAITNRNAFVAPAFRRALW